jgi:hypothetical protein
MQITFFNNFCTRPIELSLEIIALAATVHLTYGTIVFWHHKLRTNNRSLPALTTVLLFQRYNYQLLLQHTNQPWNAASNFYLVASASKPSVSLVQY